MARRRDGFWPGRVCRVRGDVLGLCLVLLAGAALRFYGLDWDGGHWLHPDERQIYFVVARLALPQTLAEALSPDSPLNPAFFAYGSLPFYLLKAVAASLAFLSEPLADPDKLHWIGRPLAVLLDLATVLLTYRLARVLYRSPGRAVESTVGVDSGAR